MPIMTTDQQTLSVTQGTIPWVVNFPLTFPVTQSSTPWTCSLQVWTAGGGLSDVGYGAPYEAVPVKPVLNRTALAYGVVLITVTGTAVQFPTNAIPEGITVYCRATSSNKNEVAVGDASVTTANAPTLLPTEGVVFNVENTNVLYVNGIAGNSVAFMVEV